MSHPRALHVSVDEGVVRLSGGVLAAEREGMLAQVQRLPGVRRLVDAMTSHDTLQEIAQGPNPVSLGTASR